MIYQRHPLHGYHMAQGMGEAKANEENGWITITKEEFYDRGQKESSEEKGSQEEISESGAEAGLPEEEIALPDDEPDSGSEDSPDSGDSLPGDGDSDGSDDLSRPELEQLYLAQFGKKPHGNKSNESIMQALKEATE